MTVLHRISLGLLLALASPGCLSSRDVQSLGERPSREAELSLSGPSSHFVSWNVHKATDERFAREVKDLLATIPEDDRVILCMQEVRSSTYDLIKDLHRNEVSGHYAPSWRYPFSQRSTGVLTISNWSQPAARATSIPSPRREFLLTSPKVSLHTEVGLEGSDNLQVINCHGLNFVTDSVFARQLDEIFTNLRGPESPAIVCGDFNVWSADRLEILLEKAREAGLAEADPPEPGISAAPRWRRWLKGFQGYDPDIALDRIFTRGIDVLECYYDESSLSSDHLPLVLRFRVAHDLSA
ncbi:MAG: endonuclease/exonuclease/phosphatase family protein [Verrucomicrobiales bacterium]